ncbi:MAG: general secretion pathway protein GspK [Desulfamplus sp.]|nr:general secretion pathway protein GspK [Desulfamplus sp.]
MIISNKGSVLVLVLWILVIISFLSGEYIAHNREKTAIVLHTTEVFKRDAAAFSILELFASNQFDLLKTISQEENGELDTIISKTATSSNKSDKSVFGTDNTINSLQNSTVQWIRLRPGGVEMWVKIENESSRVQLNVGQEQNIRTTLQNIYGEDLTKEADEFADALLDWLDPDDLVRLNGAEKAYYNDSYPPCNPANGPFKSMTEIFMVKDFSSKLFWGNPYQYILELPIYAELKEQENYELDRKSYKKSSNKKLYKDENESEILDDGNMQTILERFTIYPKDYIRVSMLFSGDSDRWYNEIFWLKRAGSSVQLVEQMSRIMVAKMSLDENR